MKSKKPHISVVIPVYNEESNLEELIKRLYETLSSVGRPFEMIFVNDGSTDSSWEILTRFAYRIPEMVIIDLKRNYGQHAAIFAGFEHARGDIIITMDADLQNPPEEIPKLISTMEEGFDMVGTVRIHRKDTFFRRVASRLINLFTAKITGVTLHDYGCMLRAYRKEVVKQMCQHREISTFIPALATLYSRTITEIPVKHEPRKKGKSKYNIFKLISLQFDLITSFSQIPLRMLIYLGFLISFIGIGFAFFLFVRRLIVGPEVEGVFTLFAILFFFIGAQFLAFGLLGEYIGRIYLEVRHRPRFIIREIIRENEEKSQ